MRGNVHQSFTRLNFLRQNIINITSQTLACRGFGATWVECGAAERFLGSPLLIAEMIGRNPVCLPKKSPPHGVEFPYLFLSLSMSYKKKKKKKCHIGHCQIHNKHSVDTCDDESSSQQICWVPTICQMLFSELRYWSTRNRQSPCPCRTYSLW